MVGIVVRLRWAMAVVLIAGIIAALCRLLPLRILLVLHPSILKPDLDLLQKSQNEKRETVNGAIMSKRSSYRSIFI